MRRLFSIGLWIIKTMLLLVALAALVLWPVSCGREVGASGERFTARPGWGERRVYVATCSDGRVVIGGYLEQASGGSYPALIDAKVATRGQGWSWTRWWVASAWDDRYWPGRWGPLRWAVVRSKDPAITAVRRDFAAPLWGVALVAGTWPLASIALTIRRRRRLRRATREGLCRTCGYDLRAAPDKSGGLLAVCPECGKESRAT